MAKYRSFVEGRASSAFFGIFTDFLTYSASDWVITTTEAGAGSATEALANAAGGLLVVTNDAADDDFDAFQWAGGTGAVVEPFKFVDGKKLQFTTRLKLSDITQCDLMAGLWITDTTPIAGVTDGIFFRKSDGSTTLYLVVKKDSTETAVALDVTLVADTMVELEWYYDGGDYIVAFADGVPVGRAATTNAPNDEELALSFVIQNGEAVAKVLTIDYVGAQQER